MNASTETSERVPWTVQSVLEQLGCLHVLDAQEICHALRCESQTLAAALRASLPKLKERETLYASALLLLNDTSGHDPFLESLAGPDGDLRSLAIDFCRYYIFPHDRDSQCELMAKCLITCNEIFAAVKRDLHEPWIGLSMRVLEIVRDYSQAQVLTRPLLLHPDISLRRMIASRYLQAGRDEGAFAVIEDLLRAAPAYVPHRDPRWNDFYQTKSLWYDLEHAAERGDAALRKKTASLAMDLLSQALDAPDCAQRFDLNDGLVNAVSAAKIIAEVMPNGGMTLLERLIAADVAGDYYRAKALPAYAQALVEEARPVVLSALQNQGIREDAARAMESLRSRSWLRPQSVWLFLHVHHLRELAALGKEYEVDPITDLRPVCPNLSRHPAYFFASDDNQAVAKSAIRQKADPMAWEVGL
jgi:hypothetical protein